MTTNIKSVPPADGTHCGKNTTQVEYTPIIAQSGNKCKGNDCEYRICYAKLTDHCAESLADSRKAIYIRDIIILILSIAVLFLAVHGHRTALVSSQKASADVRMSVSEADTQDCGWKVIE